MHSLPTPVHEHHGFYHDEVSEQATIRDQLEAWKTVKFGLCRWHMSNITLFYFDSVSASCKLIITFAKCQKLVRPSSSCLELDVKQRDSSITVSRRLLTLLLSMLCPFRAGSSRMTSARYSVVGLLPSSSFGYPAHGYTCRSLLWKSRYVTS